MPTSTSLYNNENVSLADLPVVAQQILTASGATRLFTLEAEMGAGKTTLTNALLAALGVTDLQGSPTYPIINEYLSANGASIFHIDLYRLKNIDEAYNIGIEDILYPPAPQPYVFIEWAALIADVLPKENVKITININTDDTRRIVVMASNA